jgi:ADP-ribose pyrophosphatase YjhB (NUDIX family)/nucleoside phosphorylase
MEVEDWQPPPVLLAVDLVILTLRDSRLHLLLVERGVEPYAGELALPGGFLRDAGEGITDAARRELAEEAGLHGGNLHLEQLSTYGAPGRDPRGRVVSVAHLAIAPQLPEPEAGTDAASAFWTPVDAVLSGDVQLAFDHRQIVADGVERARSKLEYTALATAFCPQTFTISELQQVYEAVWGVRLDPRNFYRKVQRTDGFLVPHGPTRKAETGRPARLFRAGPRKFLYPPMVRFAPVDEERKRMNADPVVILTALDLEYQAVREKLDSLDAHPHPAGTRFEVGRIAGTDCRVALGLVGKGNHPAAVLAERSIAEFAPRAVVFVGVAGALWPTIRLGDLVIATHVYAYHGGTSEDDGLKARPRVWEIAHGPDQIARHLARTGAWKRRLPPGAAIPEVHFGPIAAGEVVQDSAVSDHAKWVRRHYNDALAIEMEGAGVAQAAHLNDSLPLVVVRGISDRADGSKVTSDGANWQPRAAANAAAFAAALCEELTTNQGIGRSGVGRGQRSDAVDIHNTNLATGNAQVGVQAGHIGVLRMGAAAGPADLTAEVAALRLLLERARNEGQLDGETYSAARTELDLVTDCLKEQAPNRRGVLMVALKRLRGLIADVADLATKVTAIITLVRGMP